jgi:hypothetical protein
MTNIKLDRHFFIIAMTQKLFAGFYLNLYPIVVMKFFIVTQFFIFFPHPHRQLLSLSNLVRVQRDPALPYSHLPAKETYRLGCICHVQREGGDKFFFILNRTRPFLKRKKKRLKEYNV